jgi:precorrin-2/cobalt-factor-2 C20-methyltransferase
MTGTLYGVGVGPGDPELITLKALRILRAAPVLAYPAPETGDSFARIIAAPHLPAGQIEISIRMPFVTERFPVQEVYDRAAEEIGGHLAAGRDVAVLCEGDPFFYGSFMYLHDRLADRYPTDVVPGVCSIVACASVLGAPLVYRNQSLSVLSGVLPEEELATRLSQVDAAAIMKLGTNFEKVRRVIQRLGLGDRALYVERATMVNQRTVPFAELKAESVPYFSMILIPGQKWQA